MSFFLIASDTAIGYRRRLVGASPSGKALVFGTGIPRFESWRPSQLLNENQVFKDETFRSLGVSFFLIPQR